MSCPKCGTARDDTRTNCRSCGLAHDKMTAFEAARDSVADPPVAAWKHALERWDEMPRHDELLRLVTQHDVYAWAAARYRERIRADAADTIAQAQLDRLRRAAEATLVTSAAARQVKTKEPYRNTMAVLALLVIAIIAGLVYAMARSSGGSTSAHQPHPPGSTK